MGFLSDAKRGWRMGLHGVRIVVAEPELLAFPVLSTGVLLVLGLLALLASPLVAVVQSLASQGSTVAYVLLAAGAFISAFVVTTVSTFFAAGLVHCAAMVFRGEEPDVRDGLAAAWRVKEKIIVWGLIAATVSIVVRAIERQGRGGQIVAAIFGVTWGLLTYFIVPVMVLEDVGVRAMFGESARAFRERWGEYAGASVGVGVVFFLGILAAIGVLVLAGILFSFSSTLTILLVLAVFLFFLLLLPAGQAITGVVKTALYIYARDGTVPEEFADENFDEIFVEGKQRRRPPTGQI